ncbi:transketolase [Williamsoniiplasma somnilux]|uniref:Transketolase n=1 Tax=Williamsoniiplasma somnilux TaxID=215578 RepID=A0A2K8NZV8_9MOLU|nr:transketolase [Williamsoniiplasma somnilux]ATZ18748.1 transketolase [Williamsoniiplasma somnilux]
MVNNKSNDNLNAIRILGVQAVNKANSGHPGIVLGAAPMMYSLFVNKMNYSSKHVKWFNRDRFVLSAGHGSALLYSTLHLTGFNVKIDDLKNFRQWGSITPGHPEKHLTEGVEVTTGPLGQGIGMAVGMAVAESFLSVKYNKPDFEIINHYTYVLCGDGDLQEGVAQEAISFAGKNKLNKLILLHDSNDVQLDDLVKEAQIEDLHKRFEASGWNTILVKDGENINEIDKAIDEAKKSDKPTYIEVKTIIGLGASKQGTSAVHGSPLGNDISKVNDYFDWKHVDFTIPQSVTDFYQNNVINVGQDKFKTWENLFKKYEVTYKNEAKELLNAINGEWKINNDEINELNSGKTQATRISSGLIFNSIAKTNPTLIGGSADLASSTKIKGVDGNFSSENRTGRNIMYGVREFGMTTINNGMAAHGGVLPVGSGFFVFADYMKPAMRLASIMNLQELFIFTHDSIAVGEDGPTHEPIEQLAMLRAIPNHNVIRPADFNETVAAYKIGLESKTTPTSIILTRQDLKELQHENVLENVKKGAYIISDVTNPKITLIGSGSEVSLAIEVQELLNKNGILTRVVSMPSMNLFDKQEQSYKNKIIDKNTIRISLEMGTTFGWSKYTGDNGLNFGIDRFGESAPGNLVIEKFGFTANNIYNEIMKKVK